MLTNEQCIKVAEKVWGWERHNLILLWDGSYTHNLKEIREQIESWQGFGRTVEAMHEGKWLLLDALMVPPCGNRRHTLSFFSDGAGVFYPLDEHGWIPGNPTTLIKATHLAALEAIKDK